MQNVRPIKYCRSTVSVGASVPGTLDLAQIWLATADPRTLFSHLSPSLGLSVIQVAWEPERLTRVAEFCDECRPTSIRSYYCSRTVRFDVFEMFTKYGRFSKTTSDGPAA